MNKIFFEKSIDKTAKVWYSLTKLKQRTGGTDHQKRKQSSQIASVDNQGMLSDRMKVPE